MRVPVYEQQVTATATPQVSNPAMPQPASPHVVPQAFGIQNAQAIQSLGMVGEQIAKHLEIRLQDEQDKEIIRRETDFRIEIQNALKNNEDETIEINGQQITRKKGYLLRQLGQAKGTTEDFDKLYKEQIRNKYTQGLNRYQLQKIEPALDTYYYSARENIITHEANQEDEELKNIVEANVIQKTNDAITIADPDIFEKSIQDAIDTYSIYNRRFDPQTQKNNNEKIAQNITEKKFEYDKGRDLAIRLDDSYVYNQLRLGDKGIYAHMTKDIRGKNLEVIQTKIRSNIRLFELGRSVNQTATEASMIVAQVEGTLSYGQVRDAMLTQEISNSMGEKLIKKLKELPGEKTDLSIYNQIRMMQVSNTPTNEINKFILDNSDKLTIMDAKSLIDKTLSEQDERRKLKIQYNAAAIKQWIDKNAFGDLLNTGKDWQSDIIYRFHKQVDSENATGDRIDAIAQEILKDSIKYIYPSTSLMEDVPNFSADRKKVRRLFEKKSKLKGKQSAPAKTSVIIGPMTGISFDDL